MKNFDRLLLLLIGGAIGGASAYVFNKKQFDTILERESVYYTERIRELENIISRLSGEVGSERGEDEPLYSSVEEATEDESEKHEEFVTKYSGNVNNQIDYSAMAQKKPLSQILKEKGLNPLPDEKSLTRVHDFPEEDEPEVEEDEFEDEQPIKDIPKTRGIELITEEEFSDESDNEDYERIALTYYNTDGVLVDERDEPIPSPENILGQEALASFGKNSKDPDVVYVRNDLTSTLFEVARVYQSFAEVVLGITEPIVQPKHEPIQKTKVRKVKKAVSDGEI